MKRTRVEVNEERRILAGLITSTPFVQELRDVIDPSLFEASYCQVVCRWIFEYWDVQKEAPGRAIEDLYVANRKQIKDEDELDTLSSFLRRLSEDWDHKHIHSVEYSSSKAVNYFKLQSLKRLSKEIQKGLEAGDHVGVETAISKYRRIERLTASGTNMLQDVATVRKAFMSEDEVLFSLPGDLGEMVGPVRRGDFIAFAAPPKRGKTFNLIDFATAGLAAGLKVVYFNLEMSHLAFVNRAHRNLHGKAKKETTIESWTFDERSEELEPVTRVFPGVDPRDLQSDLATANIYYRQGNMRVFSYPPRSAKVSTMDAELERLETYENYVPDLVVIDYLDLAQPENEKEYRHALDSIWLAGRSMALSRNNVVLSASQQNKESMKREGDETNIAEDYRKLAHVTKLIVLNQTKTEKRLGLIRASMPIAREDDTASFGEVVLVQGLAAGTSCLESIFRSRIRNYESITNEADEDDE